MARTVAQVQNDINCNVQQANKLAQEMKDAKAAESRIKPGSVFRYRVKGYGGHKFSNDFFLSVNATAASAYYQRQYGTPNVPSHITVGVSLQNGSMYPFSSAEYELELVAGRL